MNHYAALRALTGLSVSAAATYLGVKEDTSKQWSSGRREPPDDLLRKLRQLAVFIDQEAVRLAENDDFVEDGVLVFDVPVDDAAARDLGWPSVGAWTIMAGRAMLISRWPVEFRRDHHVAVTYHRSP